MSEDEAADLAGALCGIVSDYPMDDPRRTLQDCADRLAADPGGPGRAGLVVILNATSPYAVARIESSELLADMAAALRAALRTLDADACDGGHPHAESAHWDAEEAVTAGARLLTEEHRAYLDPDEYDEEYDLPLEAWTCPKALHAIAAEGVEALEEGLRRLRGEGITDGLDERYLGPDGRVDVRRLVQAGRAWWLGIEASAAGLWTARRIVSGEAATPRDRLALLLALGVCVSAWQEGLGDPYLPAMEAAIGTVDLAAGESPCPHGDAPHPWAATDRGDRPSLVTALFTPNDPSAETFALWACPRNLADLARECLADFESWRAMRTHE
ncbi:hypothetical protein DZF91_21800 [Actinomadura logoneensis]|uniref:Uncharacterized protein n=2 Tax=Actinomadura logoneensis TaxID=2293572 RepID=A0A372JHU9_9ACTN|nr:hypothetical protein DZF91_21800 [Actinomadura logoneensis]